MNGFLSCLLLQLSAWVLFSSCLLVCDDEEDCFDNADDVSFFVFAAVVDSEEDNTIGSSCMDELTTFSACLSLTNDG